MKRPWIWLALACAAAVPTEPALSAPAPVGRQVRFVGIHAIPKSEGGGICYIEGPHVHIYAANKLEYRAHGPDHYFVGDPVAYGYDGPRFAYKGPHPVHVDVEVGGDPDVEYCYLTGPHYHAFAPPDGPDFKLQGDAYFYVGEPARVFVDARPTYIGINETYRPLTYERPVITIDAPVGWIGARAEFVGPQVAPVRIEPGIAVGADVRVQLPSIHIGLDVGGPGVIVRDRPVYIEERGKHDNGRHNGHHKGR